MLYGVVALVGFVLGVIGSNLVKSKVVQVKAQAEQKVKDEASKL